MSNTIKFIDTVIRNIKPTNKRQIFWCDSCPGFGLRVTESGSKSFVFKYMVNVTPDKRVSRWITIGKYPEWNIRKARREYDHLYEQVHDYGRDPVQEEKDEKAKQPEKITVKDFTPVYIELGRLKGKTFIDEEERYFKQDIWPVIGDKFIDEVLVDDIEKIQHKIIARAKKRRRATRDGKVAAKHAIACTRRLFNFAIKKGYITSNPVKDIEPLGMTGKRSRVLNFNEIWTFWNRIEMLGVPPVTAKALKFALATMQRSIEVRHMRYNSFKPDEKVWQMEMHETKSRTMHRVPLNRYALEIIEELKPFTSASRYIFGASRALTPPRQPSADLSPLGKTAMPQAIRRSRKALSIDDFCPHDLRRTAATWITAVGLPKLYARLMLNHSDGERDVTGEVYVQYSYDFEKQRAVQVWEFILDQIVSCASPKDIPTLEELRMRVKDSGLL
ncbi:MAG: integrase arm-type DNA-binding domain-containing protein [Candidatus Thiodiazotropha sp. (ex Ctena orbiculata)]|nr:integrase arm-type DNA-binding domain-containing protein [Candidatus Thiodiazotropha taylori]MBT2997416.1 integrase arm-type DNA-binding domain-containing protein [Candidatus Thiodiazotropha taylori]MBT3001090.1 integrase arm-type DNA-binding domain-containing protein [Candidatus Thiodiazotropha taylori]MBV2111937.1 integrase arm-type DNA-binding domain-containing protein [Candidatus Thiodiazotropha taylori]